MPNTGRPSRGCQACKIRKVKCDQELPACRRCQRNGRECPGYPSATDITFRNALSRRVSQASTPSGGRQRTSISPPMATDWYGQAICMFFYDYVHGPEDSRIGFGYLQDLPDMWSKQDQATPALLQAVSAVALSNLAHRSSLEYLILPARKRYGAALKLVKGAFDSFEELRKDTTLATVICLCFYENISGEMPPVSCSYHIEALELILRVRGVGQNDTPNSRALSYNAQTYLTMRNLSRGAHPSKESEMLATDPEKELPLRQFGGLVVETCHLLARAKELLLGTATRLHLIESIFEIVHAGIALDGKLQAWADLAPGHYRFTSIQTANGLDQELSITSQSKMDHIHVYNSVSIGQLWNIYRTTRLHLLQCLVRCISELEKNIWTTSPASSELISYSGQAVETIRRLVDDICASVPYMLGEVDQSGNLQHLRHCKAVGGLFLLHALRSTYFLQSTDPAQKAWIWKRLTYIKNSLGLQQATDGLLGKTSGNMQSALEAAPPSIVHYNAEIFRSPE